MKSGRSRIPPGNLYLIGIYLFACLLALLVSSLSCLLGPKSYPKYFLFSLFHGLTKYFQMWHSCSVAESG